MIVFDLKCDTGHCFEVWFRDNTSCEEQVGAGEVECPACGSCRVSKALMAPNISVSQRGREDGPGAKAAEVEAAETKAEAEAIPKPNTEPTPAQIAARLRKLRDFVEENCDDVGRDFPEEARKIHYGEAKARGIFGDASMEDAIELSEEGIDISLLPIIKRRNH